MRRALLSSVAGSSDVTCWRSSRSLRLAWSVSKPAPRRIIKAAHERFAHQRLQPPHASLIGGPRSSSSSLAKFTATRRAAADLVAERCDAAIRPESEEKRTCAACARNDVDNPLLMLQSANQCIARGSPARSLLSWHVGFADRTTGFRRCWES
jgi:hypothetical protein